MSYNHKELGKIVAEVLESGGYVSVHKLSDKSFNFQTPEQALCFMDRARKVFKVEDTAIIMTGEKDSSISNYSSKHEDMKIYITSSFTKPSAVFEDKL